MTVNVLLVEDQAIVRQGLVSLLGLSDRLEVVADLADGEAALAWFAEGHNADVVLMDIRMPRLDGIATLQAMREQRINVPVLVLTTFDDHQQLMAAVNAGARGYLLKDVSLERLEQAVIAVADGQSVIQPALTENLMNRLSGWQPSNNAHPLPEALTDKEREILKLMANGCSNREIAELLHKSEGTVKNQVSTLLAKLDVRDRTRAVLKALELGILQ